MLLDLDDTIDFFNLHRSLMSFVNDRLGVLPNPGGTPDTYATLAPDERLAVHEALLADRGDLIDAYLAANPCGFDRDALEEIRAWKHAVGGGFFVFRQLKNHVVFLDATGPPSAYGVVALDQPIADLVGSRLPVYTTTTLLPFRGRIVHDGLLHSRDATLGTAVRSSLNDTYRRAKAGRGVIVSLSPSGSPARRIHLTPKMRVRNLVGQLRKKLGDLRARRQEIKDFEDTAIPTFENWAAANLGDERATHRTLLREIEDLANALESMKLAWTFGHYRSRRAAADAVLADLEKERRGTGTEDGTDSEEDGVPEDIPEDLMDVMFASFMDEVRGTDVDDLEAGDYDRARAKFAESFAHAAKDDRSAFEEALFETGADRSEGNLAKVKKVFRRLAARLHPDRNPEFGDEAKEMWEELGAARKALDLRSMERLELHWQILQGEEIPPQAESRLKEFQRNLNDQFMDLRESLKELKTHPLWGHGGTTVPAAVADRMRAATADEIRALRREKRALECAIATFRGPAPARRKPAKKAARRPLRKTGTG